jgi:hypothetical protein
LDPFPLPGNTFPQFVQNLAPAGAVDLHEEHFSTFREPPQEAQNFPDASAPQDGHFIDLYSPEITA